MVAGENVVYAEEEGQPFQALGCLRMAGIDNIRGRVGEAQAAPRCGVGVGQMLGDEMVVFVVVGRVEIAEEQDGSVGSGEMFFDDAQVALLFFPDAPLYGRRRMNVPDVYILIGQGNDGELTFHHDGRDT